jgi:hypothetical protein
MGSVVRTVCSVGHPFANPVILAISGMVAFLLLTLGTFVAIDQLPCWMGNPNCD